MSLPFIFITYFLYLTPLINTMGSKELQFSVIFTPQDEGGYTVEVPELPGCISEGDSFEEAEKNIQEAIELYNKN